MKKTTIVLLAFAFSTGWAQTVFGQDLMNLLEDDEPKTEYVSATFKTTRIVNGHSIESPAVNEMIFIISHDFGTINQGAYTFFGLDQASIRLGLEYSPLKWLSLGIGRSTYQKTYDAFIKAKILRQSTGQKNIPFSLSYFSSLDINTLKWQYPDRDNYFSSRLSYVHMLMFARKFSNSFSFQLSPVLVHRNLVPTAAEKNDVFAMGAGFRMKLTSRLSLNSEYFYVFPEQLANDFSNAFAIGFDIETGGHVFQFHLSNTQSMFERGFITETKGDFFKGDIYFGFNITRVFTL